MIIGLNVKNVTVSSEVKTVLNFMQNKQHMGISHVHLSIVVLTVKRQLTNVWIRTMYVIKYIVSYAKSSSPRHTNVS